MATDVQKWAYNGGWSKTEFRAPALPSSDIKAVVHNLGSFQPAKAVLLYFVGPDKFLYERSQIHFASLTLWNPTVGYVATTAQTGDFVGSVKGMAFTDIDAAAGGKIIKRVICWNGYWIDGIGFEYTDGSKTAIRGRTGGAQSFFDLHKGEDIVQVLVRGNERLQAIQFITSSGRQSPEFGSQKIGPARQLLWEYQGQPLAGFTGSADTEAVRSLKPLWSARPARVGSAVLETLTTEANSIEKDMNRISSKVDEYNASVPKMKMELISTIKAPTDAAIADTIKLGESLLALSTASGTAKRDLIARCKAISKKVNTGFETVSGLANTKLKELDNTATDIVYWEGQADRKTERVQEMLQVTVATKEYTDVTAGIRSEAVKLARQDIKTAHAAKEKAEKDKDAKRRDRIIRDIFTLGLGEAGDWGGLNSAIEAADEIIRAAEGNERAANEALVRVQSMLDSAQRQIKQFGDLKSRLSGLPAPLKTLKGSLDNNAFDIAIFMGSLTATSAPLEDVRTAADFARGVQALQDLIQTNIKLAGEFITNPNVMNDAIKEVIASDVPPADMI